MTDSEKLKLLVDNMKQDRSEMVPFYRKSVPGSREHIAYNAMIDYITDVLILVEGK